ncbi:MAG: hypothetical protein ABEJ99_01660 [Candidatus Nanohaloarchaea archaeon]
MKKILVILAIFLLLGRAGAIFDAKIASNCGNYYEPVISISNPDGPDGHPGPPDLYSQKLCVKGIINSKIDNSCQKVTGFYLWSNGTQAHLSMYDNYAKHVCTGRMQVNVRSASNGGCYSNETKLFSISSLSNAHVAKYSYYDNKVCGSVVKPHNVTVSMNFNLTSNDDVYFDGNQAPVQEFFPPADFPYIVSEGGGHVAGIVPDSFTKAERQLSTRNTISLKKARTRATFFLPFTEGTHKDIESRKEMIQNHNFLGRLRPSFSFFMPKTPTVRVALEPGIEINSSLSMGTGSHEIKIRKTGKNTVRIY